MTSFSKQKRLSTEARRLDISVVVGIDTPEKTHVTAHTTIKTRDDLFLLITNLAPRQHPSILTLSQVQDIMQRLEEDAEDLKASDVPYVIGVQTDPQDKLRIFQHLPAGSKLALHSAHFDLTIEDTALEEIKDGPCC